MILEEIHVQNLLSHTDSHLDFTQEPLWLIWGKNGSGKSALFDAVEYALYGHHRAGKRQNMNYLIKHGAPRATIEVVFCLYGERCRLSQTIDRKSGNHGRVARWEPQEGTWTPVNVGSESSTAVWNWLEQRLPPYDLFRSAIYLCQSDTAHFFQGNADQRGQRLAKLVDLSQYTLLSERADKRRKAAEKERDDAKAKHDEQGDVSDQAVQALEEQIQDAKIAVEQARKAVSQAEAIGKDAETWKRLLDEHKNKDDERQKLVDLIQDREIIEAADRLIKGWDAVAVQLDRYWQRRSDARGWEVETQETRRKVSELSQELKRKRAELEVASTAQQTLERELIPAAEAENRRSVNQMQMLGLEVDIATAQAQEAKATEDAERLAGKDQELSEWQARERALSDLNRLARDREAASEAQEATRKAEEALNDAHHREQEAKESEETAKTMLGEREKALRQTTDQLSVLQAEIARLEGQIEARGRLKGGELACPVCDQPLDREAHDHVRQVLAEESLRLEDLKRNRQTAIQQRTKASELVEAVRREFRAAENNLNGATKQMELAEQRLETTLKTAKQAMERFAVSQSVVEQEHSLYTAQVEQVTVAWVQAERERIHARLLTAQADAKALQRAKQVKRDAQTRLEVLRSQRAADAQPLGEANTAEALRARQVEAQTAAQEREAELTKLRGQESQARKQVNELTGESRALEEQIRGLGDQADNSVAKADRASVEAEGIRQELGLDWSAVLEDEHCYKQRLAEIQELRPVAGRLQALLRADGQLEQVSRDLERIAKDLERVPAEHQLPLDEAHYLEKEARDQYQAARDLQTQLGGRSANLKERRRRAEDYGHKIQAAAAQADDWRILAEWLKPGGEVQVWITNREQVQIIDEVNLVLQKLDDPLRVRLGDPIRQTGTKIQDIIVMDITDPMENSKHFNLLSGGEQFRVALALALALHRRAAGGVAGTIIVDEGFGALDSDHRDALAQEMADTSGGILRLGLAENIILCSHSSEVQQRFPNRWIVEKRGGTATVLRWKCDDSLISSDEI